MSRDEDFLSRWSRRKRESAKPVEKREETPAPKAADLPPVESLSFDSDFAAYLKADIDERVKRAALKKLLHDSRFNVMDGLDVYIDDYTKNDPIPDEMLKKLEHVRSTLQGLEQPKAEEATQVAQDDAQPDPDPEGDASGDPRQDA